MKPSRLVSAADLMAIHRDYYQNTSIDMTVGLAAGPFGNPDRWSTWSSLPGSWERSIGIYRTAHTSIVQCRGSLPASTGTVVWFSPAQSATSVFLPFTVDVTELHPSLSVGDPNHVSESSAYWSFRQLFNYVRVAYSVMMGKVSEVQGPAEAAGISLVASLTPSSNSTQLFADNVDAVVSSFLALPTTLMNAFADGQGLQYPDWWLIAVGYGNGPGPVPPSP